MAGESNKAVSVSVSNFNSLEQLLKEINLSLRGMSVQINNIKSKQTTSQTSSTLQSSATSQSYGSTEGEIKKILESQQVSLKNALGDLQDSSDKQSEFMQSMVDSLKQLGGVVTRYFRDVFNKWDTQIATLKSEGMGSSNAAQLNRMTSQTMKATEDLLDWNISIDSAIKSTNAILSTGLNPRYLKQNNRDLIMGLQGLGINLKESTIRQLSQEVFSFNQVKELTQEWAVLTSSDTENRLSKDTLSTFLESSQWKQMQTTILRTGEYSRYDIETTLQESIRESLSKGFTEDVALQIARLQTQKRLGGVITDIPENVSTLIGLSQAAGTFKGVETLAEDLSRAVEVYNSDIDVRRKIDQISASLGANNDFTVLENFQYNDAHTRQFATQEDVKSGQYEGFLPRIGKALAGMLPAESIGGMSQTVTGDSSMFTNILGNQFTAFRKDVLSSVSSKKQIALLTQIATNTSHMSGLSSALGAGGAASSTSLFGRLSSGLSKVASFGTKVLGLLGPAGIIATVVTTGVGAIIGKMDEHEQAEKQLDSLREQAIQSREQQMALLEQLRSARLSGDQAKITSLEKQYKAKEEATNQLIRAMVQSKRDSTWFELGMGTDAQEMAKAKQDLRGYENGGIVTQEQQAIVGEGDKPEAIIPLTNPERASQVIEEATRLPETSPEVSSQLRTSSLASLIIEKAKSLLGVPYRATSNYMKDPGAGVVCNQLVEYAYNKAGIPLKSRSVHYHLTSGDWVLTDSPQPGYVIFSNYGYKDRYKLSDYGHLGIVGYGGERIHASSAKGMVVLDSNLEKTLSYEKGKKWLANGNKPYTFGYLKGVDYGTGVPTPESSSDVVVEDMTTPSLSTVADVESVDAVPGDVPFIIPRDYRTTTLNKNLMEDLLSQKDVSDMDVDTQNIFHTKNTFGTEEIYSSVSAGIQDFISRLEQAYDQLGSMSYGQQLRLLKEKEYITQQEYSNLSNKSEARLVASLDNLTRSVQESNRLATSNRPVPTTSVAPRRYT